MLPGDVANSSIFAKPVVHGMLVASMFSAVSSSQSSFASAMQWSVVTRVIILPGDWKQLPGIDLPFAEAQVLESDAGR